METIVEAAEREYPIYETTSDNDREFLMNQRRQFEKGAVWAHQQIQKDELTDKEAAERYRSLGNFQSQDEAIVHSFLAGVRWDRSRGKSLDFILNDALNKALCGKNRLKGVPHSNMIAEFVTNYLKNNG